MRHCANRECPHRRAHDVPAEFRDDIARCSDCGTTLVEGGVEWDAESTTTRPRATAGLWFRALVTAILPAAAVFGLARLGLPALDRDALAQLEGPALIPKLNVGMLGIRPILTAFVLVEIVAALVPRWRTLRTSGPRGRAKLNRSVGIVSVGLGAAQAFGIVTWAESLRSPDGPLLVPEPSWANRALMILVMLTAMGVLAYVARVVTRRGVLNGYVAFFVLEALLQIADDAASAARLLAAGVLTPFGAFLDVAITLGLFMATIYLVRTTKDRAGPNRWREVVHYRVPARPQSAITVSLLIPTSGVAPVEVLMTLVLIPGLLRNLGVIASTQIGPISFDSTSLPLVIAESIVVAVFAVVFARWFQNPSRIASLAARAAGSSDDGASFRARVRDRLRRTYPRTIALVVLVWAVPDLVVLWLRQPGMPSALTLVLLATLVLDGWEEFRARAERPDLVTAWRDQRPYAAEIAHQVLARESIPAFVRATHYRALTQFFGPHAPLEVMVPASDLNRAQSLLEAVMTSPA